jgi:hypothetical protein
VPLFAASCVTWAKPRSAGLVTPANSWSTLPSAYLGETMKRGVHDTEPVGLSRVPVPRGVDAHDVAESEPRIPLQAPSEDERLRSLLDGLGASRGAGAVHVQPAGPYDDTMRAAGVRGEAVHHAVTRHFETPARPQASSFERGV